MNQRKTLENICTNLKVRENSRGNAFMAEFKTLQKKITLHLYSTSDLCGTSCLNNTVQVIAAIKTFDNDQTYTDTYFLHKYYKN